MIIPKKIHYCWFGRNPLPESALKCIKSWKKFLPDYQIIEWNEDNFDVYSTTYTSQAYKAKKYAFVSDYARFKILHTHGGLYFDTDVEIIQSMDDIIANGAFMGAEIDGNETTGTFPQIAPGLCIGAPADMPLFKRIIDKFNELNFIESNGAFNKYTMIPLVTDLLIADGLQPTANIQVVDDITIYPSEYFNPLDDATGILHITGNTRSIHWFSKTWLNISPARLWLSRTFHRIFGVNTLNSIHKFLRR